jgi:hypothetical protein
MNVAELLSWNGEWLRARLNARATHKLRTELRRFQRGTGLLFVGLWAAKDVLIEYAGEPALAPRIYPYASAYVPTVESVRLEGGETHDCLLYRPRLGPNTPALGLLAADVRGLDVSALFDAIEQTGDAVESILVSALPR